MSNPYLFCQGQMAGKCGGVTRKKERKKEEEEGETTGQEEEEEYEGKSLGCDEWMKEKQECSRILVPG